MTKRPLLSRQAEQDLDEIWSHGERHWGVERTERYIREIWRHAEDLAKQPDCPHPA